MAIDIRAVVTCTIGGSAATLISASVSDDYIQGTGLVKTKGSCEISGLITPAIGTLVTFSYTKGGVTRTVPRKLRVLSSFADPFRRTTKVELGCKLTYLQDLQEPVKWDYTDDPENAEVDPADSAIITIPISAASIAAECLAKLGVGGTPGLSNSFSIAQFDFGAGYASTLSDLMVSECVCGYLDENETLQTFDLSALGGTGPVFTSAEIIDVAQIGVGQLPGDAVTVSYSSLKLNAPEPVDPDEPEQQKAGKNWERDETIGAPSTVQVSNPLYDTNPFPVSVPEQWEYTYTPRTVSETAYDTLDRVTTRTTTQYTILAEMAPAYLQHQCGLYQDWTVYGPPQGSDVYTIVTTETYTYKVAAPPEIPKSDPPDGYQEIVEQVQEVSEPCIKMWASTQIYDMAGQAGGTVFEYRKANADRFTAARTITVPSSGTTQVGTPCTKSTTETLRANGYTQKGQQALSSALTRNQQFPDFYTDLARLYLDAALTLQSEGTETQINTGRDIGLEQRPSAADRINKESAKGEGDAKPDPDNGWRTASTSEIELALGSPLATRRITLSMPYAPDDRFAKVGSPPSVSYIAIPSDAPAKARAYGNAQNKLLMGNRYGVNVQMAPERMPAAPFSPFILQANGLSALYRTNGTSWTMSADGILASTDALFWGAVGGTGTFWFPVAPGISALPTTPAVVDGEMTVTTPVPVWNETVPITASTVLGLTVQSLPYALELLTEVDPISTVVGVQITRPVVASAGAFTVTGNAVTMLRPRTLAASLGTYAITGNDAALRGPLVTETGSIIVTGNPATLTRKDPSFSSVSLLLHMNGSNGSTTFTDNSANTFTVNVNGNAQISTAQSKFGGSGAYFDGTGDFLSVPSSTAFDLGNTYTIEFWIRPASTPSYNFGIVHRGFYVSAGPDTWGSSLAFSIRCIGGSGVVRFYFYGVASATEQYIDVPSAVAANTWTHIAMVRSGANGAVYVDGVSAGTISGLNTPGASTEPLRIGRWDYSAGNEDFNGYIDDLRITKGVARYTASFTVPSMAFPDE